MTLLQWQESKSENEALLMVKKPGSAPRVTFELSAGSDSGVLREIVQGLNRGVTRNTAVELLATSQEKEPKVALSYDRRNVLYVNKGEVCRADMGKDLSSLSFVFAQSEAKARGAKSIDPQLVVGLEDGSIRFLTFLTDVCIVSKSKLGSSAPNFGNDSIRSLVQYGGAPVLLGSGKQNFYIWKTNGDGTWGKTSLKIPFGGVRLRQAGHSPTGDRWSMTSAYFRDNVQRFYDASQRGLLAALRKGLDEANTPSC